MYLSSSIFNDALIEHTPSLMNLSRCLTWDEFAAKDLVQDTLYRALKNRDKFQDGTNMGAWLNTMMRHIFINDFKRRRARSALLNEHINEVKDCQSVSFARNHGLDNIRVKELEKAIFRLPSCFRLPFEMYFEGYKYHEIADIQRVPLGTVKSRIFFARKSLLQSLEREG